MIFTIPAFKAFLRGLPWKNIIIGLAIGSFIASILIYVKNSEKAKSKVAVLEAQNESLAEANKALENSYKTRLNVLEESMLRAAEREMNHANAIEQIKKQPDTGCARVSQPIRTSLRLLRTP